MAMPTNLKDPKSGKTNSEAASIMANFLLKGGTPAMLPKTPWFENMWSTAAAGGKSATEIIAMDVVRNSSRGADFTTTLTDMDKSELCSPTGTTFRADGSVSKVACGPQGPYTLFNHQFSALSAWSSIGKGSYHSFQFTMRKRFAQGLTADFNYTVGKSIDLGSAQRNAGSFTGFVQNTWDVSQMRGVSNFDTLHIANAFAVWELRLEEASDS
jgi:hypothetical protein